MNKKKLKEDNEARTIMYVFDKIQNMSITEAINIKDILEQIEIHITDFKPNKTELLTMVRKITKFLNVKIEEEDKALWEEHLREERKAKNDL